MEELKKHDIRCILDERNEKIGKKIRDNEIKKIPYLLIVGEKEELENTLSVRKQAEGDKGTMSIKEFANLINDEIQKQLSA